VILVEERLPRKLAAILYADIVGYSRMAGEDEDATHRRLKESLDLISRVVTTYHGRVINYSGDAALAMFEAVVDALSCAAAIQRDIESLNQNVPDERKIQFRIGINLGDIIEDDGDIFGDGVNIAARLEKLSEPGGICISESAHAAAGRNLPFDFEFMGEQHVKNIADPVRAYHARLKSEAELPGPEELRAKKLRWPSLVVAITVVFALLAGTLLWLNPWETVNQPVDKQVEKTAEKSTFVEPAVLRSTQKRSVSLS
jgi:adenylate cyclase